MGRTPCLGIPTFEPEIPAETAANMRHAMSKHRARFKRALKGTVMRSYDIGDRVLVNNPKKNYCVIYGNDLF